MGESETLGASGGEDGDDDDIHGHDDQWDWLYEMPGKPFPPSSPLSIPPHFTSRIPKGDPLEERLHDMLRSVEKGNDEDSDGDSDGLE